MGRAIALRRRHRNCTDRASDRQDPEWFGPASVWRDRTVAGADVMSRPLLLDLYCGAGGAARGYHDAGFDVIGVDIEPQPRYPYEFHKADALTFPLDGFDAVHASPPCQAFTQMSARWRGKGTKADTHADLLTPTRELFRRLDMPWVIENVQGAIHHMSPTLTLHGGMFGLGVHRPRLFESNVLMLAPKAPACIQPIGVYGTKPDGRTTYRYRTNGNLKGKSLIRAAKSIEEASEVMGIDWMTWQEIREAIPPAYTQLIGEQLLAAIGVTV
jgi:DNA (cytosine-5)-methyltransferase 1